MNTLQKNQLHTAKIEGYTSEAYGVCRLEGRAVFVPRALAGETWRIRIIKVTDTAVYARGEELLVPSPARRDPACPYFGKCGGCDSWHMSYDEELRFKLERVNSALSRIGKQTVQADELEATALRAIGIKGSLPFPRKTVWHSAAFSASGRTSSLRSIAA